MRRWVRGESAAISWDNIQRSVRSMCNDGAKRAASCARAKETAVDFEESLGYSFVKRLTRCGREGGIEMLQEASALL